MGFLQSSGNRSRRHVPSISRLFLLLSLLLVPSYSGVPSKAVDNRNVFKVGVILDLDSHLGNQMRMAIEIACQDVNSISSSGIHYIKPHYINSHAKSLHAISAAEKLIKRKNVQVIIGLETWEGATLVAEIANQSQIPVISLARDHVAPTLMAQTLWPSLFRMSTDESDQIKCIVDVVGSYNRQRVLIIYEAGAYDTMYSKLLNSLSEELGKIGSTIEDQLILQPFSSPTGAEVSLEENLMKLKERHLNLYCSRIVVTEALISLKKRRRWDSSTEIQFGYLLKNHSPISNFSRSFSNLLPVEDAIGIITYRPKNQAYRRFRSKFLNMFRSQVSLSPYAILPAMETRIQKWQHLRSFLEYPYEELSSPRVFPKDSPHAANFSEAILEISERGEMKRLENEWFLPQCTMRNFTSDTPRLGLDSFWALFVLTIATSTGCFLFACLCTKEPSGS
ncbi:uncharacterized protein LOC104446865 [Eucalyptus grandis]|uniref:uncharacterized protein LOC104446865 n=1 Tax=Eucalyptus grandis TaxID=71139 RepID=UPI00192EF199|nr:uncharacterized protein LOC104446865 [Eucalyptus grandis]